MKRKVLSLFVAVCLIFGMLPTAAFAADQTSSDAGIRVQYVEDSYNEETGVFLVNVQAKLPSGTGISSLGAILSFDNTKLTLINRNNGNELLGSEGNMQSPKAAAINVLLTDDDEFGSTISYTMANGDLYKSGNRSALYAYIYTSDATTGAMNTGNWFDCFQVTFKAVGDLDIDSLRIADAAKDNDVIKGVFPANDIYSVYVTDNSNPAKIYCFNKMADNNSGEATGDKYLMAATGTGDVTYPSSTTPPGEDDGSSTTTSSDYEIWYELSGYSINPAVDDDQYVDYDVKDTVTATLYIKNKGTAPVSLQAYDIYLTHDSKLTAGQFSAQGIGTDAKVGTTTTDITGGKQTRIQAIGQSTGSADININLPAAGEPDNAVALGTITFTIEDSAIYNTPMNITLTPGSAAQGETSTNIGIADYITVDGNTKTTGNKESKYPSVGGTTKGAEVMTTYDVIYDANAGDDSVSGMPNPLTQTKQHNVAYTVAAAPTRTNYRFTGWLGDDGKTYQPDDPYTVNEALTLTAQWQKETVTVTWMNGNEVHQTDTLNSGTAATAPATNPTKATDPQYTYTFSHWADKDGVKIDIFPALTTDTTYYAVYKETLNKYTVIWNNYDNSELEKDEDVPYGTVPTYNGSTPIKASTVDKVFIFDKWTPEVAAITGDTTYTATFREEARTYPVTFSTAHGTVPAVQTVEYNGKASNPGNLTETHYIFGGWYTDDTYKTEYNFDTMIIIEDTTIYAKWTPVTYTVTFNANNGIGTTTTQEITYGETGNLNLNTFTAPAGKKFQNWNTNANGTGTEYANGASVTLTGNLTLYAQWTDASYDVIVDKDNIENGAVSASPEAANMGDTITLTATHAEGYELVSFEVVAANGDTVNVSEDGTFQMPGSNVTVTATFQLATYSVSIDTGITNGKVTANPSQGTMGTPITLSVTPDSGYKVTSVYYTKAGETTHVTVNGNTFNMPASNVTVFATFAPIEYTVTFDSNASDTSGTVTNITATYGTEIELSDAEYSRIGYTFEGWATTANATEAAYEAGTTITDTIFTPTAEGQSVTLYAVWTPNEYTVTLVHGYDSKTQKIIVTYDSTYAGLAGVNTDRDGYTFDGWFTAAENGDEVKSTDTVKITVNQILYAHWTAEEYTVTLKPNGGNFDGSMADKTENVTYDEDYTLTEPSRNGYTFAGWKDGEGNTVASTGTVTFTDDLTLTAQWTANTYIITFDPNGGNDLTGTGYYEINKMQYTIESTASLPTPTHSNPLYKFRTWTASEADTNTSNWQNEKDYNAVETALEGKYGSVKLTAQWDRVATVEVEQYKYAADGDWMLLVDATNVAEGQEYKFDGASMYYMNATDGKNYLVDTDDTGVFYTLISGDFVEDGALTDAGYQKLATGAVTDKRATIDYVTGDINGDENTNIADANIVYQMIVNGGGYYGDLKITERLAADMDRAARGVHRGSIGDVAAIMAIINGTN